MTRLTTLNFWPHPPKNFWSAFNFYESVSTCKKSLIPSTFSSDTINFRVPPLDWPHPFSTITILKTFKHILIYMNLHEHAKNQLIPSVYFSDAVNFRVQRPDWPHPFLTMPHQKIFNQHLNVLNLYQNVINEAASSISSGEIVDLKIPSDWLRSNLAYISGKRFFPIEDLCRNTADNTNSHYRKNSVKINDQIFL